jgi:hypothetical protein
MAKKNNQKITIEDVEYDMSKLSDNAKSQVQNIQFVDSRLQQLHNELAISDTARIGYSRALKNELLT